MRKLFDYKGYESNFMAVFIGWFIVAVVVSLVLTAASFEVIKEYGSVNGYILAFLILTSLTPLFFTFTDYRAWKKKIDNLIDFFPESHRTVYKYLDSYGLTDLELNEKNQHFLCVNYDDFYSVRIKIQGEVILVNITKNKIQLHKNLSGLLTDEQIKRIVSVTDTILADLVKAKEEEDKIQRAKSVQLQLTTINEIIAG